MFTNPSDLSEFPFMKKSKTDDKKYLIWYRVVTQIHSADY